MNQYPEDNELIDLICENNEEATDLVYDKYKYIVDIVVSKYKSAIKYFNIDRSELYQEAMVGFSDAIRNYLPDSEASLPTFISLCVERKINNYIRKYDTLKSKINHNMISLDETVTESDTPLQELISGSSVNPLDEIEAKENLEILKEKINDVLSPSEKDVYKLMVSGFDPDQISKILNCNVKTTYNAIYRIRQKIKDIM